MLYVALLNWKAGLDREEQDGALIRRSQWEYPDGITLIGEYWPATHAPAVISVFEASEYEPIMELNLTWQDFFDITIVPTTTPEEGLQIGPQIMQRRVS